MKYEVTINADVTYTVEAEDELEAEERAQDELMFDLSTGCVDIMHVDAYADEEPPESVRNEAEMTAEGAEE